MANKHNNTRDDGNNTTESPVTAEDRIKDNNEDPAPWRPAEPGESGATKSAAAGATRADKETGDPGRTPGSAEGVEDFQKTGNQ